MLNYIKRSLGHLVGEVGLNTWVLSLPIRENIFGYLEKILCKGRSFYLILDLSLCTVT